MAIDSNLAGVARVAFEAETGEFNRDVSMAEQRYKKATEGMSDSAIRLELAQNRLHRALAKGPSNYQAIARAELAVRRESSALNRELDEQSRKMDRTERSLGRLTRGALMGSGALGRFGRTVSFASATFLGGAGLAYAFTSTLKLAGDFQRSLNILRAVTGATAGEMAKASEEAKRLGRDVTLPATSAKDAAEAMTTLGKAGLGVENSIAGAEGVLRLAAAAGIDVASAANIAAKSISAFGLDATETTRVADVFANAANASIGEIDDYALALAQSAQVAKDWNLSIEETVATLALFAKAGIQGSDAGTSLRVMLSRLVPTSDNAKEAFEELHISAFEKGTGRIKSYRQILSELHEAFKGLTPEQKKLNIQMIFGQDAQRGAGIAILNTIENYDKMLKKIEQQGSAQKLAAARNKGYVGSLDAFKSAVETLQITIGTALLPTFTRGLKSATDWVNKMEKSGEATEQVKGAVDDAVEVFKALKDIFMGVKAVADPLIDAVGGIKNAIEIMTGFWVAMKVKSLISFGAMATASKVTSASMVADAAVAAAAWGAVPGGGAVLPGGRGPGPLPTTKKPPWYRRVPPVLTSNPAILLAATIAFGVAGASAKEAKYNAKKYPRVGALLARMQNGEPPTEYERSLLARFGKKTINDLTDSELRWLETNLVGQKTSLGEGRDRPNMGRAIPRAPRPPRRPKPIVAGGARDGLTALQRAEIASAEATTPGAELSAERSILSIYERELATTTLTGKKLYDLRIKVAGQRKRVRDIEQAIATDAKNAREQRQRDYVERRGAEEQELRNRFDEALATPGRTDDRRAFIKLRNYLQARVNDAKLERDERAKARKRLNALRKEWTSENEKAQEAELDAQEQVLQNDVKAAELTEKNTKDDLKAHRRLRDFYKKREKDMDLTKKERQEFRGKRLDEQEQINKILRGEDEGDAAERKRQTAQNLLDEFNRVTSEFSSNVMYGVPGGGMGYGTVAPTSGAGGVQVGQPHVTINQHFKAPTADRHREARMAWLASKAQFLG